MIINMKQTTIILILVLTGLTSFSKTWFNGNPNNSKQKQKVTIITKWVLPDNLNEVSGICWIDEERIACIPDGQGIIAIYNISSSKIENQIHFADTGDFEAITKKNETFYVMRSDGQIFEISNSSEKTVIKQNHVSINEPNDIEGLFYDKTEERLLIVNRLPDPKAQTRKGIFAFDLSTKKLIDTPIYELDLSGHLIENTEKKKDVFLPSDIAVHPITSDIYLTDGIHSCILVLDPKGIIKNFIELDKKNIPKPEGITFSPKGDIYLSSEGKKQNGFIVKVKIANIND